MPHGVSQEIFDELLQNPTVAALVTTDSRHYLHDYNRTFDARCRLLCDIWTVINDSESVEAYTPSRPCRRSIMGRGRTTTTRKTDWCDYKQLFFGREARR